MDRAADKYGLDLLIAAFVVGVTGDALCRAVPWGINVPIWISVTIIAFAILIQRRSPDAEVLTNTKWLAIPALLFAACFAWRDSATLRALDAGVLALTAGLVQLRARKERILIAGVTEYICAILYAGVLAIGGMFGFVLFDIPWGELPRKNAPETFCLRGARLRSGRPAADRVRGAVRGRGRSV